MPGHGERVGSVAGSGRAACGQLHADPSGCGKPRRGPAISKLPLPDFVWVPARPIRHPDALRPHRGAQRHVAQSAPHAMAYGCSRGGRLGHPASVFSGRTKPSGHCQLRAGVSDESSVRTGAQAEEARSDLTRREQRLPQRLIYPTRFPEEPASLASGRVRRRHAGRSGERSSRPHGRSSRPHGRSSSTRDQPARPSLVSVSVPRAEHRTRPVNFVGGK